MKVRFTAVEPIQVGNSKTVEAMSTDGSKALVFEDDGATGYVYVLQFTDSGAPKIQPGNPNVDALHIYNVDNVNDKQVPTEVAIGWSLDQEAAILLINQYPHAIVDFANRHACCRTGFPPPPSGGWSQDGHAWKDEMMQLFE